MFCSSKFLPSHSSNSKYIYSLKKKTTEMNYSPLWPRSVVVLSRIDAASLGLRGHYSWIAHAVSRVFHAYTCRSRIQRRSRCIVLWLSSKETSKRRGVRDRTSSIDRKRLARRFYIHIKENGNARCLGEIYFRNATSDINFPRSRYYKFSLSRILKIPSFEINNFVPLNESSSFSNSFWGKNFYTYIRW